jgi:multicomponent Na+:H+ antiporter subunit F
VVAGPTVADRAVGADVAFYVVVAGFAVLSVTLAAPVFLDVVLVATLLGFVASVSLARLIGARGHHGRATTGGPQEGEEGRR